MILSFRSCSLWSVAAARFPGETQTLAADKLSDVLEKSKVEASPPSLASASQRLSQVEPSIFCFSVSRVAAYPTVASVTIKSP